MAYGKKRMMRKRPALRRKKGGVVRKAIRKAKKTVFAKRVKAVVNRMSETKCVQYSVNNYNVPGFNSTGFSSTIKLISPASGTSALYFIAQGTGQGNREGNVITTVRARLKGVIHITTNYDSTVNYNPCPLYVVMYIFKLKSTQEDTSTNAYNTCLTSFFQAGSTQQGFSGRLYDLTRAVNTSAVTLLKKRVYKVGLGQVVSGAGNNVGNTLNNLYADSTVGISRMFSLDITDCLAKKYYYNDTANSPTNKGTFIMWVPLRVDGEEIVTASSSYNGPLPCKVDFSIDYTYKDM